MGGGFEAWYAGVVPPSADPQPGSQVSFADAVRAVLVELDRGEVVTYGEVAAEAGRPGAARAVGQLLARSGGDVAWWRVVNATGRLAPGKESQQSALLRSEGVEVGPGGVVRLDRRGR